MPNDESVPTLGWRDRLVPVWILAAMGVGIALGAFVPALGAALDSFQVASVSLPIAIGLLVMMYPPLTRVRYEELREVARRGNYRSMLGVSLLLNWVVGPFLMFTLAWLFLPDRADYRTGLIFIGIARCIAMVLVWNWLARGDGEYAAVLVAVNSMFQVLLYAMLAHFFVVVLPPALSLGSSAPPVDVSTPLVALSVGIFLGIPFAAGYITRAALIRRRGAEWFEQVFVARTEWLALAGLLFTIVVMFSLKGDVVLALPMDVVRIAIPLVLYFLIMFATSYALSMLLGFHYGASTAQAFTAASNNFELAVAVTISVFGIASGQALAAVVGPLVEVPVLLALVSVALWVRRRFYDASGRPTWAGRTAPPGVDDETP